MGDRRFRDPERPTRHEGSAVAGLPDATASRGTDHEGSAPWRGEARHRRHSRPAGDQQRAADGRRACIGCGTCVGFTCPSDGKNGTQNTTIKRAIATRAVHAADWHDGASLQSDERGKVTGVEFADAPGNAMSQDAKIVVLAAGAIETPRLLLNSATDREPDGLGNNNDLGRSQPPGSLLSRGIRALRRGGPELVGPGVTIATTAFSHGNPGLIGGGMLADDFVRPPILFFKQFLPPDLPRWGQAAKDFMRDNFNRVMRVIGPVHEIPTPDARVRVAPGVRDRWGMPVAMLSGDVHPETIRTATYMHQEGRRMADKRRGRKDMGQCARCQACPPATTRPGPVEWASIRRIR